MFDVLIVGAGLAGASLACALTASRLQVGLVEARPPGAAGEGWDARVYALSPSSAAWLDSLGIWQRLPAQRMCPVHAMEIYGDRGARLDFSAFDSGVERLAWIAEQGPIQRELWETARRQGNLTLFCPAQPQALAFDADRARLALADGRVLEARLVVAADGANSWVRSQAAIRAEVLPYGELGVVANFACDKAHRDIACQWFRSDGVLAWLPLPGRRFSMVWSAPEERAKALLELPAEALCREVAAAGAGRLGALTLLTPAQGFPLRLMRVAHTVAPHLALIGDAAHTIHPLSGHGINLGFKDAQALADVLLALAPWCDPGDINTLRRYARARVEEVLLLQGVTHALQRLFRPQWPPLSALRNFGLQLTQAAPVVRNALVRYALG